MPSVCRSTGRFLLIAVAALACAEDGLESFGPSAPAYQLMLVSGDSVQGAAGQALAGRVRVQVLSARDTPVRGARVFWRVTRGGGQVSQTTSQTNHAGLSVVDWVLGGDLTEPQTLEVRVGDRARTVQALTSLPGDVTVATSTAGIEPDTIGALLPSRLQVQVLLPDGRPVSGAAVDFVVQRGGGRVAQPLVFTDSAGDAITDWQLGDSVGTQEVIASVRGAGQPSMTQRFTAFASPSAPASLRAVDDTIRFDALPDTVLPLVVAYDRAGNQTPYPVTWTSLTPSVVAGLGPGGVASVANGLAQAIASSGSASLTLPVLVAQVPVSIRQDVDSAGLYWLGSATRLRATMLDRLGSPVSGVQPAWRSLDPTIASVDGTGLVRAGSTGVARIVAEIQNLADTAVVVVAQHPASIAAAVSDTLDLDERRRPVVTVYDSGGTAIPGAVVEVTAADPTIVSVEPNGELNAAFPGRTELTFRAGVVSTITEVTVDGVAVMVNGQRAAGPEVVSGLVPFTITNGRIRVSWSTAMGEIASVEMDVRLGATWHDASARDHGDWVYVASSVRTLPTRIEIVENTPDRVAIQMRFDDHWFLPALALYPDSLGLVAQPYPFVRTIWLRKGDNGYYSWVDVFNDLQLQIVEHETGFGGLWGPATIRTNRVEIRTDTLSHTVTYNGNPGLPDMGSSVDAAEFVRDDDPVRRFLVPLPEAPFITPVFPGWGYGSVYRYGSPSRSFGVYMYATGVGSGPSGPEICKAAWTNAPFALHAVSDADFDRCGPQGP